MPIPAKVNRIMTKGYMAVQLPAAEVTCDLQCEECEVFSCPLFTSRSASVVAEDTCDARQGDIVLLEEAESYNTKGARIAYIMVPIMFVLGCFLGKVLDQSTADMFLTGAILAFLNFILAWFMNRKARLRRVMSYRAISVIRAAVDRL